MSISPEKLASATALRTISHAGKEKQPCIRMADLCRPGLQFAGYFDIFAFERPQVIGKTEMAYLDNLPDDVRCERLERYFSYDIPCIIIARRMKCPPELLRQARKNGVPVYGSDEETSLFSAKAITYLSEALAPRQTCHGVLLDVFGVGLMITGESGVGIVDIKAIFGIGSIVRRSRIDLVIHLEFWQEGKDYDRLGNKEKTMEILGVELPLIELPVRPGRSLAMVVEIAARNWRLKAEGYDAVAELDRRLKKHYTHQE